MTDEVQPEDKAVDDFFEGEETPEIATEVAETETVIEGEVITKGETEEVAGEVKPANEETEPVPPADKEPTLVPIAALHDERRKAQQAKEEIDRLRSQIPNNDEAPDPYEDIDAYNTFMRGKWDNEQSVKQESARKTRIETARGKMLEQHTDFTKMERIFEIMVAGDATLFDKMIASGDEVGFAYSAAKAYETSVMGGITTKTEKTDQEPTEAELRNKSAVDAPNLATATAQASNSQQLEKESDIDDVFEDMKY